MSGIYGKFKQKVLSAVGNAPKEEPEIAIALEDYEPTDKKGIPFKKGDRFIIKSKAETNWWHVKRHADQKVEGFVPSNFLIKESDLENVEWISFNLDRDKAVATLRRAEDGSFLIRTAVEHINNPNLALSLSVKVQNPVCPVVHFQIHKEGSGFKIGQSFGSLSQLVEHYAGRRKDPTIVLTYSVKRRESVIPWEYSDKAIEKGIRLDRGYFGEVFTGFLNGEVIAIKSPDQSRMDPEDYLKEAEIARYCKHPNVLETIGICRSRYFIITEFMANGSLKKFLRKREFTAAECLSVVHKIACAMEYLDSKKIVHRDLAARNVLVGETIDIIKVCDFGLARSLEESKYYYSQREIFPRRWTAPEAFVKFEGEGFIPTQRGKITSAADVWSFAVVMWEVYSNGKEPYDRTSDSDLYRMITVENKRLERPEQCPEVIYTMMLKCWSIERKHRPNFTELRSFLASQMAEPPAAPASVRPANSDTEDDSRSNSGVYNEINEEATPVRKEEGKSEEVEDVVEEKEELIESPSLMAGSPDCGDDSGPPMRPTSIGGLFGPNK